MKKIRIFLFIIILFIGYQFFTRPVNLDEGEYEIVKKRDVVKSITTSGRITYPSMLVIKADVSRTIKKVNIKEGDLLKKDEILLSFENKLEINNLKKAELELKVAKNNFEKIKNKDVIFFHEKYYQSKLTYENSLKEYKNGKILFEKESLSKTEYEDLIYKFELSKSLMNEALNNFNSIKPNGVDFNNALSEIEKAELNLSLAKDELEDTIIKAPFNGIVLKKLFEEGEYINLGKEILILAKDEELIMDSQIDEKFLPEISIEQEVVIKPEAFPDTIIGGKIIDISPYVNVENGTVLVKIKITKPPNYLKQDLTVLAEIITDKFKDKIVIAKDFLINDGDNFVLLLTNKKAVRTKVKLGVDLNGKIIVESGINSGDIIILPEKDYGNGTIKIKNFGK